MCLPFPRGLVNGFGLGLNAVAVAQYVSEVAPANARGTFWKRKNTSNHVQDYAKLNKSLEHLGVSLILL